LLNCTFVIDFMKKLTIDMLYYVYLYTIEKIVKKQVKIAFYSYIINDTQIYKLNFYKIFNIKRLIILLKNLFFNNWDNSSKPFSSD